MIQPASLLESCQSGIMPGSSAGQKKAPICTSTCAAQTTATNLAGDRAKLADVMAMTKASTGRFAQAYYHTSNILEIPLTLSMGDASEPQ